MLAVHHEHVAAHAQVARDDVGDLRLAAVAVEQHELAHAGAGTLSPISVHSRISVSADRVNVPGEEMCSFDLPIGMAGRNVTGTLGGSSSIARAPRRD